MAYRFSTIEPPPKVAASDWNSWLWQMKHALKNKEDFAEHFDLQAEEAAVFEQASNLFQFRTTPYYAQLADAKDPRCPIRKILMPHQKEHSSDTQEMLDPLGEKNNNPRSRIIHRYSDRCLFLVTDICSVYCRYCTRKHFTGKEQAFAKKSEYQEAIEYINETQGIREVILSGGDPLTLSDSILERIILDLKQIEHIDLIRIGTRMPVVCPMRVTDELVQKLKAHHPIYIMLHFNHPKELTKEAAEAIRKLVDNGFPCMNQMVLLNGVNNHPAVVQALSRRLLSLRVKPYYMFQCDPSEGTDHLRTSIEDSLEIQRELWGHMSGLAMPNLSVDIPDGGGKAYYVPNFEVAQEKNKRSFVGWDGVRADYISPLKVEKPQGIEDYIKEWQEIKSARDGHT